MLANPKQSSTEEVEVHVICCGQKPVPSPEKLAPNIWYHQIILPKWRYLRSLHNGPILAVRKLLQKIQPDIIHAQGTERWCAISGVFNKIPKVLTIHGNLRLINKVTPMEPKAYWKLQEFLETFSIPRYDGVVCITNYTKENVSDLAKRTWVVPNAMDLAFFDMGDQRLANSPESPSAQAAPGGPVKILVVGHIQARKNQVAFIDALRPLAEKCSIQLRFFGSGERVDAFSNAFFDRIEELPWCHFGGMLGRPELREEFRDAAILVLPSLEDNCPMSVLEAMASGVPVIAPNVGGVPDLIRNGDNGLLIDPLSADSMRSAVEKLLNNPESGQRFAKAARRDAEVKYHPRVIAERHVEIYREVIGKHRTPTHLAGA